MAMSLINSDWTGVRNNFEWVTGWPRAGRAGALVPWRSGGSLRGRGARGGEWSSSASHPTVCCLLPSLISLGSRLFHVHPGSKGSDQDWEVRGRCDLGLGLWSPRKVFYSRLLICDWRWRVTKLDWNKLKKTRMLFLFCWSCSIYSLLWPFLVGGKSSDWFLGWRHVVQCLCYMGNMKTVGMLGSTWGWGKEGPGHANI